MPRIDPDQLLKTLSKLLAPSGGIRGQGEVVKIVQLMQRFSKKLVSKIIYIQILKSTDHELLDKFLAENGWELLNHWFIESITNQNWALCKEMIALFSLCPISAERLKGNIETNQAPRLINQLRQVADEATSSLAADVYNKWVDVVSPSPAVNALAAAAAGQDTDRMMEGLPSPSHDCLTSSGDDHWHGNLK